MFTILKHTPVWVWILFIFLIYRGVSALKKRTLSLWRLLVLPVLFFVWAVLSIWGELQSKGFGFAGFVLGLVVGGAVGWQLWRNKGSYNTATGLFDRSGSAWTLVLVLFAFVFKFALSVNLHLNTSLATAPGFCLSFGSVSGLVDGIFWGGTINLLGQMWKVKKSIQSRGLL